MSLRCSLVLQILQISIQWCICKASSSQLIKHKGFENVRPTQYEAGHNVMSDLCVLAVHILDRCYKLNVAVSDTAAVSGFMILLYDSFKKKLKFSMSFPGQCDQFLLQQTSFRDGNLSLRKCSSVRKDK